MKLNNIYSEEQREKRLKKIKASEICGIIKDLTFILSVFQREKKKSVRPKKYSRK